MLRMEEKKNPKAMSEEELEKVSGGYGRGGGYYMTVGNCSYGYLPLLQRPEWDQYNELGQLYPGCPVFTYGETANGIGLNGAPCTYRRVCFNGNWGWADDSCLLR